ncbi:hypothetical protein WOSG25_110310 [Weissella oryzae SG25]|uniref:DUF8208 domain-containing protein n=1 Tax=Weissella oryzae (strain DSM 25784 / JCM 18191 / LMG 30913 / SG25) TaxID=1329250 RepID=A0A069CWE4_WEIOS|nr:hypothetical protein [Weissella oryzae]GAK31553.1 hypothetical protein WOSG25_110310 [Weissella oryzae SG25]
MNFYLADKLIPLPDSGPTHAFYQSWIDYLTPTNHIFITISAWIMHAIALFFYNVADGVQTAWSKAWDLVDFSKIFTSSSKTSGGGVSDKLTSVFSSYDLGHLIWIFLLIGFVVLGVVMAIQMFQFSLTNGQKGKDWPKGLVTSMIVIAILPVGISSMLSIAKGVNGEISKNSNPVVTLWKSNSVDLTKLDDDDFKVKADKLSDYSPILNEKNSDDDAVIKGSIFENTIDDSKKYKDKDVFKKKADSGSGVEDLASGNWATGKTFAETYPVVKTNWMGIILGEIVFVIVGVLSTIEILVRTYRLAYYSLSILYFGFRDIHGKKAVRILQLMEGSITGMAMMPISLILFYAWVQFGFDTIKGMSWWPFTILSIAILFAGYKGLMGGMELIDEFTGTQSGHSNAAQSVLGAAVATKAVLGAGKTAARLVSGGASKLQQIKNGLKKGKETNDKVMAGVGGGNSAPNSGSATGSTSNKSKSQKAAKVLGAAGAVLAGKGNLAESLPSAAIDKVAQGAKNVKTNVSDSINKKVTGIKDSFNEGQQAVQGFGDSHATPHAFSQKNKAMNEKITGKPSASNSEPLNSATPSSQPVGSPNAKSTQSANQFMNEKITSKPTLTVKKSNPNIGK